jgi:hypothetical protein
MTEETPLYQIRFSMEGSTFDRTQILQILATLPLIVEVKPLESRLAVLSEPQLSDTDSQQYHLPEIMVDYYGAQIISLMPPEGKRLVGASMCGPFAKKFYPSRIMDERSGGKVCSSYHSNTRELGLPFDIDFCVDIYKESSIEFLLENRKRK